MITQPSSSARPKRALLIILLCLGLAVLGFLTRASQANASQFGECNTPSAGAWYPICFTEAPCTTRAVVKNYHAVANPYQTWVTNPAFTKYYYYGSFNDFLYHYLDYPDEGTYTFGVEISRSGGSNVAHFYGGTYSCV
jgi:hypothetical protein